MKEIVQHPIYGEIIYNENFWTGKKKIAVNGVDAQPISKKDHRFLQKDPRILPSYSPNDAEIVEGGKYPYPPDGVQY